MRRRLLTSTLVVAVVAVVLLGVPLGLVGARLIHDEARQRLTDNASRIAVELESRQRAGNPLTRDGLTDLIPAGRYVVVMEPKRPALTVGSPISGGTLSVRVKLADGGTVEVASSRSEVNERVNRAWGLVGALVLLSTAVAVGLAVVQARRLGEPLEEFAVTAGRLGSGDTRPHQRRYGVPELDRVAEVLDRSAERLGELLRRQRDFAADASHQLRTPLTALSIRLEEIGMADDPDVVREEAAAALAQVERLTAVVDSLLARARDNRTAMGVPVNVTQLLRDQGREWRPAYRRAGRILRVSAPSELRAAGTPGGLAQAVGSLIENALVHGRGAVDVRARETGEHVVIEVTDEGPGVDEALAPHVFRRSVSGGSGTGLGLALARALVEADGGRLELVRPRPPVFTIFLSSAGTPFPEPRVPAGATPTPVTTGPAVPTGPA